MKQLTKILLIFSILYVIDSNAQEYFQVENTYPDGKNGKYTVQLEKLKSYSSQEIDTAFKTIIDSDIYFDYPQGGCQNRAEIIHIYLAHKLKIEHAKIWIFAPVNLYPNDNRHLEINDPNGNAKNGVITWKYHVAPAVIRKNFDGKKDTLIIDPSINNKKPMLLNEWLGSMGNSDVSKYTFLESKWYMFNTKNQSSVINGFFYPYESHFYEDFHRSTMERGLAANDLAEYMMKKLEDGYVDTNGRIKQLLSNQDNIYNFFMNPYWIFEGRADLLANHSNFMRKAEEFYWKRLAFWKEKTNKLLRI